MLVSLHSPDPPAARSGRVLRWPGPAAGIAVAGGGPGVLTARRRGGGALAGLPAAHHVRGVPLALAPGDALRARAAPGQPRPAVLSRRGDLPDAMPVRAGPGDDQAAAGTHRVIMQAGTVFAEA